MSAVPWGLLFALAVLVVLALAVLVTPVKLGFMMRSAPRWRLKVVARLLGGLTPPIQIHDSARQRLKKKPRPAKKQKKKRPLSRQALAKAPRMIAAPKLVVALLQPIRLERLAVDADIGLPDPADTGQLFGLLAPLIYSRSPTANISIALRPDFSTARISGEVSAELSVVPVAFVPPAARFAWRIFGWR